MQEIMAEYTPQLVSLLIGLIGKFKQEHKSKENSNREAFENWLSNHRFDDLKEFISRSDEISREIDVALQEDHDHIIAKLKTIDKNIATMLQDMSIFAEIVSTIYPAGQPTEELSKQAISILQQLSDSNSGQIYYMRTSEPLPCFLIVNEGSVKFTEPKFIESDLDTLVDLNLIKPTHASDGNGVFYTMTRQGDSFLKKYLEDENQE